MSARPKVRLFFDGGGCLWAADAQALDRFGFGPLDAADYGLDGNLVAPPRLTLSAGLQKMIAEAIILHATYLNAEDPLGPSPWGHAEFACFRQLVDGLLLVLQAELGAEIEIIDAQPRSFSEPI